MMTKMKRSICYYLVFVVALLTVVQLCQILQADENVVATVTDSPHQQLPTVYLNARKFDSNDLALLREKKRHPSDQYLSFTKVTDDDLLHIKKPQEIQVLRLRNTSISNAGMLAITKMTNLVELDLSKTKITDAGMIHLKGLTKIEALNLSGTKVEFPVNSGRAIKSVYYSEEKS